MPNTVYVLNGPNLNLLGTREPEIYGRETLDEIRAALEDKAEPLGLAIDLRQTNHEGQLIDWIHEAQQKGARAVILNPGGYTHTSVALHDAIKSVTVPVIEVHLSNVHAREPFRRHSYVAMAARGTVAGFGPASYLLALQAVAGL